VLLKVELDRSKPGLFWSASRALRVRWKTVDGRSESK